MSGTPEKYRPSNGTAGEAFISSWCGTCARDKALRDGCDIEECDDNERCDIVGRTMTYHIDNPEYPVEWRYDASGRPVCTAYIPAGLPIPAPHCAHTRELF